MGALNKKEVVGALKKNTECGIYGRLENISDFEYAPHLPPPGRSEIQTGKTYILSDAMNGKTEKYDIERNRKSKRFWQETADKEYGYSHNRRKALEKDPGGLLRG